MNKLLDTEAQLGLLFWFLVCAPIVCGLALWLIWRKSRQVGIWATAIAILAMAGFVFAKSVSPTGKYVVGAERISVEGDPPDPDEFYDLTGGKVYVVVDGKRDLIASYYKTLQGWVWESVTKHLGMPDKGRLRFSLIGFDTVDLSGQGDPGYFNRRRVIPFSLPRGMPYWLQ